MTRLRIAARLRPRRRLRPSRDDRLRRRPRRPERCVDSRVREGRVHSACKTSSTRAGARGGRSTATCPPRALAAALDGRRADAVGRLDAVQLPYNPRRRDVERELLPLATEDLLESAESELEEEVGLEGGRWRKLGTYFTSPGFLDEQMHLFAAEDLEQGEQKQDDDEEIELVRRPVEELDAKLAELEDLKTVAALLLYLRGR